MKAEKYIIINNCSKKELKTILNDWLDLYASDLKSSMYFGISEVSPDVFIIKVDKDLDDEIFFYLVNYCSYPESFQKTYEVEGHACLTKPDVLLNKNVYVFINENDPEGDNVWITTEENETYKYDFGGECNKVACDSKYKALSTGYLPKAYERIIIDKLVAEAKRKEDEEKEHSVKKRFKIISIALLLLIPLVFLTNRHFSILPDEILIIFPSVYIALWFISDYKIFNDTVRTMICLLISSLCVIFGTSAGGDPMAALMTIVAAIPLSTVVVMWVGNRFLGAKLDYFDKKHNKLFFLIPMVLAVLISVFIFYPIISSLK